MANAKGKFQGFPHEGFDFLSELSRNNDRVWFDAHRGVYDTAVVSPALSFVEDMGTVLQDMAPSVKPEPRVGGSLFRIHRDVRFSADKSPYKTHVGIRFRDRDTIVSSKCTGPLFYVEFDSQSLRIGVGVKAFDSRTLHAYRGLVAGGDGTAADRRIIEDAVISAERNGHQILGPVLARTPRGYADEGNQDLLRRKGFFVWRETAVPIEIHGPEFVDYCMRWFRPYGPLFECLRSVALSTLRVAN